jgi:phosphoribosylformylglycinamidine synthase subunit PurS
VPVHKVLVDVLLKPEILDPQGQAVANALPSLGFAAPVSVRVGKHVEVEVEAETPQEALEQVVRMADVLLANPVIEDAGVRLA